MFEIGIYKRADIENNVRILLIDKRKGFIFNTPDFPSGTYAENWREQFNVLDKDHILSEEDIQSLQDRIKDKKLYNKIERFLSTYISYFTIINNKFLVSENKEDTIKISILDRVSKIDDNVISIEYSGKKETLLCKDYDQLQKVFMNIGEVF